MCETSHGLQFGPRDLNWKECRRRRSNNLTVVPQDQTQQRYTRILATAQVQHLTSKMRCCGRQFFSWRSVAWRIVSRSTIITSFSGLLNAQQGCKWQRPQLVWAAARFPQLCKEQPVSVCDSPSGWLRVVGYGLSSNEQVCTLHSNDHQCCCHTARSVRYERLRRSGSHLVGAQCLVVTERDALRQGKLLLVVDRAASATQGHTG